MLLTGSLPSGHEPAKLCIDKNDKTKIRSRLFIKVSRFKWDKIKNTMDKIKQLDIYQLGLKSKFRLMCEGGGF
jgi:hypothetical protein